MTRVLHSDAAEVDCQYIKGGVGGALEEAAHASHERVWAVVGHGFHHHAARTAAREGLHNCRGQCVDERRVAAREPYQPPYGADEPVHSSRSAEHSDGYEKGNEVRDNPHGGGEAVLGTVDERFVDVHLAQHGHDDEAHDDSHQHDGSHGGAHRVHHGGIELCEAPHHQCHQQAHAAQSEQQRAVEEVYLLVDGGDDDACQRCRECGKQYGNEHVGGLCCALLCAIGQYRHRDDGQAARVEHQKHDHRVGGCVLLVVKLLQVLHGLQSQRGGGIVEAKHIGGYVHKDGACGRVSFRYVGEESDEHGGEHARQKVHQAGPLAYLHHSEPQCQHTGEAYRDFKRTLRCLKGGVHHCRKDGGVAEKQEFHQCHDKGNDEESYPDIIKYHGLCCLLTYPPAPSPREGECRIGLFLLFLTYPPTPSPREGESRIGLFVRCLTMSLSPPQGRGRAE